MPFLHVEIEKGENPRRKRWECKKGRKQAAKKGGKRLL
jgi:hypothetical protein